MPVNYTKNFETFTSYKLKKIEDMALPQRLRKIQGVAIYSRTRKNIISMRGNHR